MSVVVIVIVTATEIWQIVELGVIDAADTLTVSFDPVSGPQEFVARVELTMGKFPGVGQIA